MSPRVPPHLSRQNQNHNLQKGPGCKGFQGLKHRTIESRVPLQPTIPRLREKRLDLSPREVCYFLVIPGMAFAVILLPQILLQYSTQLEGFLMGHGHRICCPSVRGVLTCFRARPLPWLTQCSASECCVFKSRRDLPNVKTGLPLTNKPARSRVGLEPATYGLPEKHLDLSPREVHYFLINPGMVFAVTGVWFMNQKTNLVAWPLWRFGGSIINSVG